jgi:hypothetical protein
MKRIKEKDRQRKLESDRASSRRWEENLRVSSKEASASARAAEKELRLDNLWRQVKAQSQPKGRGKINKFLWHGELPEGGPIKAQPAAAPPGVTIKEKKTKPLTVDQAYTIALKGTPIPPDRGDPNEIMMQKQLMEQVQQDMPGLPNVPLQGPQHYQTQTATRQPIPQPPEQPGATGMGGPLPFAQPMEGGGYDITAPAQAMLNQYPDPSAGQQMPLQHLFKQISAMGGGKGGGKSKLDDLSGFAQALDMMGMGKPNREEIASIFGASKGGAGKDIPKPKIKGEGGRASEAGTGKTARKRFTSMKAMTADPMLVARITHQLSLIGLTLKDVQVDEKGVPFVIDPRNDKVMRFTQVEGVK